MSDSIRKVAPREEAIPEFDQPASLVHAEAGRDKELPSYPGGTGATRDWFQEGVREVSSSPHADDAVHPQSVPDPGSSTSPTLREAPLPQPQDAPIQPAPLVTQPVPAPAPNNAGKIPPFREILAIKNTNERIQTYNQTRTQFASMDTGLSHWLASTANTLPEHADIVANQNRSAAVFQGHTQSPSRTRPGGGGAAATPPSSQAAGNTPGNLKSTGSSQEQRVVAFSRYIRW